MSHPWAIVLNELEVSAAARAFSVDPSTLMREE
jgi:hypothetical protein